MKKFKELYIYTRKKGLKETIKRLYSNYFHVITFILYKRDLSDGFIGIMPDPKFKCVEGKFELLKSECKIRNDLPREFYIDETHGGKTFYLVYCEGELAYIHWILKKGEYSRFFKIQDETTVEFNYNTTLPKFRGNRLQAKIMNYICDDLKAKGYKKVVGAVSAGNILSIKGMNRTGLKEFKRIKSYFSLSKKIKV